MTSNTKLAQILQKPRAWAQVSMLESELRDLVIWVIEYLARLSETDEIVEEIATYWKEKDGPGPGHEED